MFKNIDPLEWALLVGVLLALWTGKILLRLPADRLVWGAFAHATLLAVLVALLVVSEAPRGGWPFAWSIRSLFLAAGAGFVLFLLVGVAYAISSGVLGLEPPAERNLLPDHPGPILVWLLTAALLAAVLEEWLFRGILLGNLLDPLSAVAAVPLAAGVFALYHLSAFQILPTFILGLGLGLLTLRTESLAAPITAHLVFNTLGILLSTLVPVIPEAG